MATLSGIELGINTGWLNEFDGAAIELEKKYTEDGRLFVFQTHKKKFKTLRYDCGWQTYATLKQLEALRDSGAVGILVHNDARVLPLLLQSIDALPLKAMNSYLATSKFKLTLNFMDI